MKVSVIISAYNEAPRLAAVLQALQPLPEDWELLVVSDGSTDATADVARECGAAVLELARNEGKGAAMWAGATATRGEIFLFLDADLRRLNLRHAQDLIAPVACGEAEMAVGLFRGGRGATDLSHWVAPWISGQRAITRAAFLELGSAARVRQGIEALLTRAAKERGWRVRYVNWPGVTHAMKEEKLGLLGGLAARARMYVEVARGWLHRSHEAGSEASNRLRIKS